MSFKVIDVNTIKKHVISDCYDRQHVCAYICNRFHDRQANYETLTTFRAVSYTHLTLPTNREV